MVIRKVTPEDVGAILSFLVLEPQFNLFILGDIENHGLETDYQEVWAQYTNGKVEGVLLRYFGSYIIAASEGFKPREVGEFLVDREGIQVLSGRDTVVDQVLPYLPGMTAGKRMHFACLTRMNPVELPKKAAHWEVKLATEADVDRVALFRSSIVEFSESRTITRQSLLQTLRAGAGRCYYIEKNGEVIASAQTTAEYQLGAMVVGVAASPAYRHQGLATACMYRLCTDLLREGKSLSLFYENPLAAELYYKLGFVDIGYWRMAPKRV